jgi:hypothetical protein
MFLNFGNAVPFSLVTAQSIAATANGTGVDTSGYDSVGRIAINVGVPTGTSPTLDMKFQSSADNSTGWTDITGAAITQVTSVGGTQGAQVVDIDLGVCSRYVRAVTTLGGTTSVFPVSATMTALVKQ